MTPAGRVTTLVRFDAYITGAQPHGKLIQGSDGNFYGTTRGGGPDGGGTVFRMTSSGLLTTLVSFNGDNGTEPVAGLIQGSDGNFYGTTLNGGAGAGALGTVFKMTPAGDLTTLVTFTDTVYAPFASLIQAKNGYFYGTTYHGGTYGGGTIFRMSATGTLKILASLGDSNLTGSNPYSELIQAKDGNFYGTTPFGPGLTNGSVFKMTPQGSVTTLLVFDRSVSGAVPDAGLVQAYGGFYGTTSFVSTVFKLVP